MPASLSTDGVAPGDQYAGLVRSARDFLDAMCGSAAPGPLTAEIGSGLDEMTARLREYAAPDALTPAGHRPDLPGQGHPLQPPTVITAWLPSAVHAEVVFGRAHDGSGGVVHGGLLPLVYDDVLGRLAARSVEPVARTAFLHVEYEAVTPIGRCLHIEGRIDRIEGRKIYASGRMLDGAMVLTTATALFVALKPHQP